MYVVYRVSDNVQSAIENLQRRKGQRLLTSVVLVGKPERRSPRGIPEHRGKDNIKMRLKKIGLEDRTELMLLMTATRGGLL